MADKQYRPMLLPRIKNVAPMSEIDKIMSPENMRECNKQLWAGINQLLQELDMKMAIEHRDGSVQVLDDTSQILEESFKDLKGRTNE